MKVRKQQLEQDMEQQTGSKKEKEYVKAVYCHPVYLTTRLSQRAVPRATVLCVDPRLESRGSAGKTGFPGMD